MTTTLTISGADVRTPREAKTFASHVSIAYAQLVASLDQFIANQKADNVADGDTSREPYVFLGAMTDQATGMSEAMTTGAQRAAAHLRKFGDTWAADPSLAGTQTGGYGDAKKM